MSAPRVVHGWDGLPRIGDRYGPIYMPGARMRATDERAEDLDIMGHPLKWPAYPALPVKRYTEDGHLPDVGIMVPGSANVYHVDLWSLKTGPLGPQVEGKPVDLYASHSAAYDDGWRVD